MASRVHLVTQILFHRTHRIGALLLALGITLCCSACGGPAEGDGDTQTGEGGGGGGTQADEGAGDVKAGITKITLTINGVEVEGTITGDTIHFPGAPRGMPSLSGVVSLRLSPGARVVEGANPHGTTETFTDNARTITVQTKDGTKKTFKISVAPYHPTDNPYGVYTVDELHDVRSELDGVYRLMQDLTLPSVGSDCKEPFHGQTDYCVHGFKPIGKRTEPFTGTFDGNGHRIQNLFMEYDSSDIGLFGRLDRPGTIQNLDVAAAEVTASAGVTGDSQVGVLVGNMRGGNITDAHVTGAVAGDENVGGLVGLMVDGAIRHADATGAVSGSGDSVGGLVGHMYDGAISNVYATGDVTGDGDYSEYVGGLVGFMYDGTISNAYATGAVTGNENDGDDVGGLVGRMDDGTITIAYATGDVTGNDNVGGLAGSSTATITIAYATGAVTGNHNVGGLVGLKYSEAIQHAYAIGTVSGDEDVGGLVGDMNNGTISNAYATGAVSGDEGVGGLVGSRYSTTITHSYYPAKRPQGPASETAALPTRATENDFAGFVFSGMNASWNWVDGKWPQLKGIEATQKTPSLVFHDAAVEGPSATGFTVTLSPALDGRAKEAWALYDSTSTVPVMLKKSTAASGGARYTFEATLTRGASYHLIYTKADVIVVPAKSTANGFITIAVPN